MGYNPHKPGRPSHASHSYQVSGLRLMLGVDVLAGNESHANHTLPGLLRILDGLASPQRPHQWGGGGFTTHDLARCRLSALAAPLIYNWWSLFVRLGNPKARMEAITSRTFLLSAVARQSTHGGTRHLTITSQHAEADKAKVLLTVIHALIDKFNSAAEQFKVKSDWQLVCEHIVATSLASDLKSSCPSLRQLPIYQPSTDLFRVIQIAGTEERATMEAPKSAPVKFVKPREGAFYTPVGFGLVKNAPDPNAGKLYIDFALSEAGQKAVADTGYLPLRNGVSSSLGPDALQGARLAVLQTEEGIKREPEFAKKLKVIFFP